MYQGQERMKEQNNFFCKVRDTGECTKNLMGETECEFCKNYLECGKCANYDTIACDRCMIWALKQDFGVDK